jgi:hypothetical protein
MLKILIDVAEIQGNHAHDWQTNPNDCHRHRLGRPGIGPSNGHLSR